MKKLALLFLTVIFATVGTSSYGQGSYVAPEVGNTFTYKVTETSGNTYAWDVTSDVAGTTSVIGSVASFVGGTNNAASVQITWDNPSIGATYYVHVIETADGCSNRKALAVVPVNNFALEIVSVDPDDADTDNGENYTICPADVTVTAYNGTTNTDFNYDYGRDEVYFKISASGINTSNTGWSPQFTIAHNGITGTIVSAGWSTAIDGTYSSLSNLDGTTANDIDVNLGNSAIWIKVEIDNQDADSSGNEGTTANGVLVELLDGEDTSEDGYGNDVTNTGNGSRNQVISARPATSAIGTN